MDAHKSIHTHTLNPQGSNCSGLSREEVTIKMPLAHSHSVRQRESVDNKILAPPVNLLFGLCQRNKIGPLKQIILSVINPLEGLFFLSPSSPHTQVFIGYFHKSQPHL